MIGILNYGMSNLHSVLHATKSLGIDVKICSEPKDLEGVAKIIFPGVGSFAHCMATLISTGFLDALQEAVLNKKKPILGICLGMQVMGEIGDEGGTCAGLGWFEARIKKISISSEFRIPHVGWNNIYLKKESTLFEGISTKLSDFYFVHSYHMQCTNHEDVIATVTYGNEMTAAIQKNNIVGVQFHPEKSQDLGLRVLNNFITSDFSYA